jgi:hypothetical protein
LYSLSAQVLPRKTRLSGEVVDGATGEVFATTKALWRNYGVQGSFDSSIFAAQLRENLQEYGTFLPSPYCGTFQPFCCSYFS